MYRNMEENKDEKLQIRVKIMLIKTRIGLLKSKKVEWENYNFSKKFEKFFESMNKIKEITEGNLKKSVNLNELDDILFSIMLEIENMRMSEYSTEKDAIICFLKDNVSIFDKILECLNEIK